MATGSQPPRSRCSSNGSTRAPPGPSLKPTGWPARAIAIQGSTTGPGSRWPDHPCLRLTSCHRRTGAGWPATSSTGSFSPSSPRATYLPHRRPIAAHSSAASRSTSSACRPRPRMWPRSSPTNHPMRMKNSSTACSPRPTTANAGPATGSTSPTTPTPTASNAISSGPTPGGIATG